MTGTFNSSSSISCYLSLHQQVSHLNQNLGMTPACHVDNYLLEAAATCCCIYFCLSACFDLWFSLSLFDMLSISEGDFLALVNLGWQMIYTTVRDFRRLTQGGYTSVYESHQLFARGFRVCWYDLSSNPKTLGKQFVCIIYRCLNPAGQVCSIIIFIRHPRLI